MSLTSKDYNGIIQNEYKECFELVKQKQMININTLVSANSKIRINNCGHAIIRIEDTIDIAKLASLRPDNCSVIITRKFMRHNMFSLDKFSESFFNGLVLIYTYKDVWLYNNGNIFVPTTDIFSHDNEPNNLNVVHLRGSKPIYTIGRFAISNYVDQREALTTAYIKYISGYLRSGSTLRYSNIRLISLYFERFEIENKARNPKIYNSKEIRSLREAKPYKYIEFEDLTFKYILENHEKMSMLGCTYSISKIETGGKVLYLSSGDYKVYGGKINIGKFVSSKTLFRLMYKFVEKYEIHTEPIKNFGRLDLPKGKIDVDHVLREFGIDPSKFRLSATNKRRGTYSKKDLVDVSSRIMDLERNMNKAEIVESALEKIQNCLGFY